MYSIKISGTEEGDSIDIQKDEMLKKCRACLKRDGVINLYNGDFKNLLYRDLFVLLSILEPNENDSLPQLICQECADFVDSFYSYKNLVNENQMILKISLKINSSNDSNDNVLDSDAIESDTFTFKHDYSGLPNLPHFKDHDYSKVCNKSYTCPSCLVVLPNKDEFIRHRLVETKLQNKSDKIQDYTCLYCNLKFTERNDYMNHMKQKDKDKDRSLMYCAYSCPTCNLQFQSRLDFLKHRREEAGFTTQKKKIRQFTCKYCDLTFNAVKEFKRHMNIHTKPSKLRQRLLKKEYSCGFCRLKFSTFSGYLKHRKAEIGKKTLCPYCKKVVLKNRFDNHLRFVHKKLPPLQCEICSSRFLSSVTYDRHLLGHKVGYFCEKCGQKCLTEASLKAHLKKHTNVIKKPICELCNKEFKHPYLLREHMYSHTGEKPYLCSICGVTFKTQTYLYTHNRKKHKNIVLSCNICDIKFDTELDLREHQMKHKNKEIILECRICNDQFTNTVGLKLHLRKHGVYDLNSKSKDKKEQVQCLSCGKVYDGVNNVNYQKHIRSHIEECPYLCLYCGAQFFEETTYEEHLKTHKGRSLKKLFECEICHKIQASKAILESHMRYHTGEKPFRCNLCFKTFHTRAHLKTHLFWHTGEKPHSCKYCGKNFALKGNCVQHERSHTNENLYECVVCEKTFSSNRVLKRHFEKHGTTVKDDDVE